MNKIGLLTVACTCAVAIAAIAPGQNAEAKSGLPACSSTITACGCVINSPGDYEVGQALTGTSSSADCIDIKAKNVNLNTESYDITGPGAVGINVLKSAKNANVQLGSAADFSTWSVVSGFTTGMQIAASNTTVFNGELDNSTGDGLVFTKSAKGSRLMYCGEYSNGGNGVTVNGASNLVLDDFSSEDNSGYGLAITGGKNLRIGDFDTETNGSGGIVMTKTNNSVLEDFGADDTGGAGIVLNKTKGDTLVFFEAAGDPADGIDVMSSKGDTIQDFDTYFNTLSGVVVSHSKNINVVDGDADENGVYGVQLQNTSKSLVNDMYDARGDAVAGVYVGCETKVGPAGTACADIGPSNSNVINGIVAGYDPSPDDANEAFGVAVDYKDSNNLITGVYSTGATTYGAIDENSACDSNTWFNIAADTATPSCIPAVTPLTRTTTTQAHGFAQHRTLSSH